MTSLSWHHQLLTVHAKTHMYTQVQTDTHKHAHIHAHTRLPTHLAQINIFFLPKQSYVITQEDYLITLFKRQLTSYTQFWVLGF